MVHCNSTLSAEIYKRSCLSSGLSFSNAIYKSVQKGAMKRGNAGIDALLKQYRVDDALQLLLRLRRLNSGC